MRVFVPLFALAALACNAGTIISGSASYRTGALPTSQTSTNPAVDFRPFGGTTTDHLVSNWWYYRVAGDTRERPLGNYTKSGGGTVSTTEVSAGDTSNFTVAERDAAGNLRFSGVLAYILSGGPTAGAALLRMSFSITNPTSSTLAISLFNYLDANVQNTATNDTAILFSPTAIRITDSSGLRFYHAAIAPTAYQVTSSATLRSSLLNSTVTNLNNTGLPYGPGNYTGAWQWNLVIAPGATATVRGSFGTDLPLDVPEPSSPALLGAGIVLLAILSRRGHLH